MRDLRSLLIEFWSARKGEALALAAGLCRVVVSDSLLSGFRSLVCNPLNNVDRPFLTLVIDHMHRTHRVHKDFHLTPDGKI